MHLPWKTLLLLCLAMWLPMASAGRREQQRNTATQTRHQAPPNELSSLEPRLLVSISAPLLVQVTDSCQRRWTRQLVPQLMVVLVESATVGIVHHRHPRTTEVVVQRHPAGPCIPR